MARGSGRTIPSVLGGGLAGGTRAILDAVLERERRETQEELETRRLDIAERTSALNRFITLASYMPVGTTLGDLGGAGQEMFATAFDMDVTGLEDLELNRETLQTALDARARDMLEEDPDLALPSVRNILGLEPSEDVANLRDLEAEMRFNALRDISRSPDLAQEYVQRALGRDPVTLTIPGFGDEPDRQVHFPTELAATLYAQLLQHREEFGFRLQLESLTKESPAVTDIQEAVAEAGHSVSPQAIMRVIGVYNDAVEANDPSVIQEHLTRNIAEGEKLALEYVMGSIGIGEEAFLSQLPENLSNYFRLQNILGKELDPEETVEIMKSVTQALDPSFTGVLRDPVFGGLRLELSGAAPAGSPAQREDMMIPDSAIQAAFEAGDSREDLVRVFGEERISQVLGERTRPAGEALGADVTEGAQIPEGGMNPDAVPLPFRSDVQQLNNLVRTLERTRGELARQNLERAIERLRERIRAGVSGGE